MVCKAKWQPLNEEAKSIYSFGCCVRGLGFFKWAASITHQLQVYESDNLSLWSQLNVALSMRLLHYEYALGNTTTKTDPEGDRK